MKSFVILIYFINNSLALVFLFDMTNTILFNLLKSNHTQNT